MRVSHVACGVRRCMWVWRLREDHVELSRCACVRKGRGRMCGSPLTYRACQAAVPRGGTRHAPGTVPLAVTLAVCFDDARGRCNFSKNFRAASGSSFGVREIAIWSRIMIRVCETISRGLAVALPPGAGRPRVRVGVRP